MDALLKALSKLASLSVLGLIGVVGLKFYNYQTAQQTKISALEVQTSQLKDVIDRLSVERRMADFVVADQVRGADGKLKTSLLMVEYDAQDHPMPARSFTVVGDRVHIDGLVVKFDADAIQKPDALRGHAFLMFEKIYGDAQAPVDAARIDSPDAVPAALSQTQSSQFEQSLWKQFWQLCTDASLRAQYGVRVAHGVGVFEPFSPGNRYTVTLQADGNVTLHNEPLPEILQGAMKRGGGG